MRKRSVLSILLLFVFLSAGLYAQNPMVCRIGFAYEISQAPNWGKGKPVITEVFPYSSAEQMGLKVNDIIESIDGLSVSDINAGDIPGLLNPAGKNEVLLSVSNLGYTQKDVSVRKECKRRDAITEDQLASAFSMYSLETTGERLFVCPFKTTVTTDSVDFALFKTFAFTEIEETNRKVEEVINVAIEKALVQKGLTVSDDPDMVVQTFYFFNKNPNYMGKNKILVNREPTYRYNYTTMQMEKYPFLGHLSAEAEAEYLLQYGFRFVDQKYKKGRVIWECEANELLESAFRLENYAVLHTPLMCAQFPYVKYSRNVQFSVAKKTYNYTGISYDINRMELVSDVDRSSVAFAAGVRPRDVIEKIDNQPMNFTAEEFTSAYKQFITNTMKYRNPATLFTDANGFRQCMYWDKTKYALVANVLQNPKSRSAFSYLYKFAPYVDPSATNACTFHIKRGSSKMELIIRPTVRTETTIVIK